jgi:hypothetical protein
MEETKIGVEESEIFFSAENSWPLIKQLTLHLDQNNFEQYLEFFPDHMWKFRNLLSVNFVTDPSFDLLNPNDTLVGSVIDLREAILRKNSSIKLEFSYKNGGSQGSLTV